MSNPVQSLVDLAHGHIAARCLHVIAEFGVADALDEERTSAAVLAERTGLDADALNRMLRLLSTHGVFAYEDGGYVHTAASRLLRSDHPQSLRSFVRMHGLEPMWGGFTALAHAARTGKPAGGWPAMLDYLREHPKDGAVFNEAMVGKSRRAVPAIIEAYDFSRCERIADIGGGHGHLLRAILEHVPHATGVLFDLPQVVAEIAHLRSARFETIAGDFFTDPLPAADTYLLMDLLHDWPDDRAARILAALRRAAPVGARALIVEALIGEGPGREFGKVLDVIMLATTGGRERTVSEHEELLRSVGFELERVIPTRSNYSIVEAVAKPS
ncbi:MAG: methyltransferase [Gammaproteobacteria bacterium]|nr:SAM-dependent methyltransferase [Gammaproteobacteria bacterium]